MLELRVEAAQVGQFVEPDHNAVVVFPGGAELLLLGLADGFEIPVGAVGDGALDGSTLPARTAFAFKLARPQVHESYPKHALK